MTFEIISMIALLGTIVGYTIVAIVVAVGIFFRLRKKKDH
jgi:hypothetical protein